MAGIDPATPKGLTLTTLKDLKGAALDRYQCKLHRRHLRYAFLADFTHSRNLLHGAPRATHVSEFIDATIVEQLLRLDFHRVREQDRH